MDFSNYIDMSLVIICLVIGKIIKECKFLEKVPNNLIVVFLPVIAIGIKLSVYGFSVDNLACALYSALVAIGTHQTGKQLFIINKEENYEEDNEGDDEEWYY